jgi:hypothetical protein
MSMPDRLVLILGAGRSGTSALARLLGLCGGTLPEPLLGAAPSNPKGHFEPLEALKLNEAILARRGSCWYDPSPALAARGSWSAEQSPEEIERIAALLAGWPRHGLVVVKEPRISELAPLWLTAAARSGREVSVVVALRHPRAMAASLVRRDGVGEDLALLLWLKYLLLAERSSRGARRVFVDWPALLADWRGQVARIGTALDLPLAPANPAEIDAFLDPALSQDVPQALAHPVLPLAQAWREFSAAATDRPLNQGVLDSLYRWLVAMDGVFGTTARDYQQRFAPAVQA